MPDEFPRPLDPPRHGPVHVGLLGRKIGGSLSPFIHQEAARLCGQELRFSLLEVEREDELGPALRRAHQEGWRGLSVTMPWKRSLSPFLQGMSPEAISIGSVNLLLRTAEGWIGENSDAEGFLRPLARRRLAFSRVLLVGAGGAARAVAHVLASMPFVEEVLVRNRRLAASQGLVDEFATERARWVPLAWEAELPGAVELIINATPLGQDGDTSLPCPTHWIHAGLCCYDLVTHPAETPFLVEARRCGAGVIPGREMLVGQARRAFTAWTGQAFPEDELRSLMEVGESAAQGGERP